MKLNKLTAASLSAVLGLTLVGGVASANGEGKTDKTTEWEKIEGIFDDEKPKPTETPKDGEPGKWPNLEFKDLDKPADVPSELKEFELPKKDPKGEEPTQTPKPTKPSDKKSDKPTDKKVPVKPTGKTLPKTSAVK